MTRSPLQSDSYQAAKGPGCSPTAQRNLDSSERPLKLILFYGAAVVPTWPYLHVRPVRPGRCARAVLYVRAQNAL